MNLPRTDRPEHPDPEELGHAIAELGDEVWVAVRRATGGPQPVAAIYLLERAKGRSTAVRPIEASSRHLLAHALGFRHLPGRAQSRFRLLGDLAAETSMYRLESDLVSGPAQLVDLVQGPARERAMAQAG
jgi:hypothetical protein